MTPARMAECLHILDWTQRGVARRMGRSEQNIRQMLSGTVRIPPREAAWLERLARFHERNPAPERNGIQKAAERVA